MRQNHLKLIILLITSALSFFWLTAHLWEIFPLAGQFTQRDPDALLFSRFLEQSILKGKLIETDSYSCYPYEINLRFPPFYLWFLYRTTLAYFVIFPESQLDPIIVAGFLPIVLTWLSGVMILLAIYKLSRSNTLFFLCCYFLLPGYATLMACGFLKLDYDFLNAFLIWLWIIAYLMFYLRRSNWWLVLGGLAATLFLGTWTGAPLFFFFATCYGFCSWLWSSDDADIVLNYLASTMLIGGMVNLVTLFPSTLHGDFFSLSRYSYFQPGCVFAGGLACHFLRELLARKVSRLTGVSVIFMLVITGSYLFREPLLESTGIMLRRDPIHQNISELTSRFSLSGAISNNAYLRDVMSVFGLSIVFFPFFVLLPWRWCDRSPERFLRFWLCLMIILSCYQIRYIRWMVIGCGLYYGITFHLLWEMVKSKFDGNMKSVGVVLVMLPLMVAQTMHNFTWIKGFTSLSAPQVELFTWIRENTPETSGYFDDKRPEYGILAPWDYGNFLGFYAHRPSVVNNAMWGFKTMADIFSAKIEDEAAQLCSKYRVRYIVIPANKEVSSASCAFWPMFKDMPEKPEYTLSSGDITHDKDFGNFFYFWLMENLALLPRASFNASSFFRLVYVSKSPKNEYSPYLLYEKVLGAKCVIKADPLSTCQISLEVFLGEKNYLYKKSVQTDQNGIAKLIVPYSTSHKGGRIKTDPFYKTSFYQHGKFIKAKLRVKDEDVLEGADVSSYLELLNEDEADPQRVE